MCAGACPRHPRPSASPIESARPDECRRGRSLSLRRQRGATTAEVLVISGLMVGTILIVMAIFRQQLTTAVTTLSKCVTGAVTGDVSGCRGGGTAQQAAAPAPSQIPGMRNDGIANGLVMTKPGSTNVKSLATASIGLPNGRGSLDPKQLSAAQAQLASLQGRIKNNGVPDPSWQEQGVRLWNATSLFQSNRDLNARQDELNAMSQQANGKAQQWVRTAEQRLANGDLAGFNEAMNNARRYNNMTNSLQGRASSVMADAADQAMSEAANVRNLSFETASAIGNPVGYIGGKASGLVVSTAADYLLPDGRIKQVVVAVGTAAGTALAGGMTPTAWTSIGGAGQTAANAFGTGLTITGQSAATAIGVADQLTSVYTTYNTQGGTEAAWEVATMAITHGVMNTKVFGPGENGTTPRSLNEVISQSGSAATVKQTLENNMVPLGQVELTAQNAYNAANNAYNSIANPKVKADPISYKPLEADPAFVKTFNEMKNPKLSDDELKAAASMGWTPEMANDKVKKAMITGVTQYDRETNVYGTQDVQAGRAEAKPLPVKIKSAGEGEGNQYLPMNSDESKAGKNVRTAQEALDNAGPGQDRTKLQDKLNEARSDYDKNNKYLKDEVASGQIAPILHPTDKTRGPVAGNPKNNNLPWVADCDGLTNNVSKPGERTHGMGDRGVGTYAEHQDVANTRGALAGDHLQSMVNHGQGVRNPAGEHLPDKVIVTGPDGHITVLTDKKDILTHIRSTGSNEADNWHTDAGMPPPSKNPTPAVNPGPTEAQIALANNRNTIRTTYVQNNQFITQNNKHDSDKNDRRVARPGELLGFSKGGDTTEPDPAPPMGLAARQASFQDVVLASNRGDWAPAIGWAGGWRRIAMRSATTPAAPAQPSTQVLAAMQSDLEANAEWDATAKVVKERYGNTWADAKIREHEAAYRQLRAITLAEAIEKEQIDGWVRSMFNLRGGGARPTKLPVMNQSAVYERIDWFAAAGWRGTFDATIDAGLHVGLVQHYTELAFAQCGRQAYPASPIPTAVARAFSSAVGDGVVGAAFFNGDTWRLYARVGALLGAKPEAAIGEGRAWVLLLDQATIRRDVAVANALFARLHRPTPAPAGRTGGVSTTLWPAGQVR